MSKLSLILLAFAVLSVGTAVVMRSDERKEGFKRALGSVRGRGPLIQTVLPAVGALLAALWFGLPARRVAREAALERDRVERLASLAQQIRTGFVPATDAETAEWTRTRGEVADFGVTPAQRLALAHAVARLADDAGLSEARVAVVAADSAAPVNPRMIGSQQFAPTPYRLRLTATGELESAAELIRALPPSVDVQTADFEGNTLKYLLAVFQQPEPVK